MKSRSGSTPWVKSAVVTALILAGLAILWMVVIGPAVLILLSPR